MAKEIKYLDLKKINDGYGDSIKHAIMKVVDSGWYLQGEAVKRFEAHYARYIGTRHCISCGNGLDALKLLLQGEMILGRLQPGDEIIVPANTYIATLLAITSQGLSPILVEPQIDTLQIDADQIESHLSPRTRAIMAVHLYGKCSINKRLVKICQEHGLRLYEDNAQAHGCICEELGKKTGSLGNAAAHSFYPGKNLGAMGDAGAVTTDDDELAEVIEALHNYGSSRKYIFDYTGRNSRMDEIQAAVLEEKLKVLDSHNQKRSAWASLYEKTFEAEGMGIPQGMRHHPRRDYVVHILPFLTPRRDELQAYLKSKGVETMIHYPILPHQQKCYQALLGHLSLPITERISRQELSLPCNESMTEEEVRYICQLIRDFHHPLKP